MKDEEPKETTGQEKRHNVLDALVRHLWTFVSKFEGKIFEELVAIGKISSEFQEIMEKSVGEVEFLCSQKEKKFNQETLDRMRIAIFFYEVSEIYKRDPEKKEAFMAIIYAIKAYLAIASKVQ